MNPPIDPHLFDSWRVIEVTKTVAMNLTGWRKNLAILLRRPLTHDVKVTGIALTDGDAEIDISNSGQTIIKWASAGTHVIIPQREITVRLT